MVSITAKIVPTFDIAHSIPGTTYGVRIRSAFEAVSVHFAMVVQYCQTYTDRKDGKTLATVHFLRFMKRMASRTVRTEMDREYSFSIGESISL